MPWASTLNSPNCPTPMVPPLQSISLVIDVNVPSSVVTGLGNADLVTVTCQPDPASGLTETMGWASGNWTLSPTTDAAADSLGTRNVRMTSDVPFGTAEGCTVTCADATVATPTRTTRVPSTAAAALHSLRIIRRCLSFQVPRRRYCTVSTKLTLGWLNSETCTCRTTCHFPTIGGFGPFV